MLTKESMPLSGVTSNDTWASKAVRQWKCLNCAFLFDKIYASAICSDVTNSGSGNGETAHSSKSLIFSVVIGEMITGR
jgi:hypothetical protein